MGSGFSVVFVVFESPLSGAYYLISLGGEVTHALVFVFTAHITHCKESCSRVLTIQGVSESRVDIVQPGVGGKSPSGRYPGGAIAPCLCTVIYCSL